MNTKPKNNTLYFKDNGGNNRVMPNQGYNDDAPLRPILQIWERRKPTDIDRRINDIVSRNIVIANREKCPRAKLKVAMAQTIAAARQARLNGRSREMILRCLNRATNHLGAR